MRMPLRAPRFGFGTIVLWDIWLRTPTYHRASQGTARELQGNDVRLSAYEKTHRHPLTSVITSGVVTPWRCRLCDSNFFLVGMVAATAGAVRSGSGRPWAMAYH